MTEYQRKIRCAKATILEYISNARLGYAADRIVYYARQKDINDDLARKAITDLNADRKILPIWSKLYTTPEKLALYFITRSPGKYNPDTLKIRMEKITEIGRARALTAVLTLLDKGLVYVNLNWKLKPNTKTNN